MLRSYENYSSDIATQNVSLTGIKEECLFNSVRSYHVVENCTVDVMHDYAEGQSHYVMIEVLKHCIQCGYFTIDVLNSRMFYFHYGPADSRNKPSGIAPDFSTKPKIKCTVKEMFTLVRLLGVFVGDLVPHDDMYRKLYLMHKDITEIILSKNLPLAVADDMDLLVHEHLFLYLNLTGRHLPPKFHYGIHYGGVMRRSGPPSQFSSMRGESKHTTMTKYAHSITSRKDLPQSAAIMHQLSMCLRFIAQTPIVPEAQYGPGEWSV